MQGFPGAVFKGFSTKEKAEAWYGAPVGEAPKVNSKVENSGEKEEMPDIYQLEERYPAKKHLFYKGEDAKVLPLELVIYTDGSCLVNPDGAGGFAAVFLDSEGRELLAVTGGEPFSMNNRMELRAAYEALKTVNGGIRYRITFHTDSKYLQQAVTKGWLEKWKRNGWMTASGGSVLNQDLWKAIDELMGKQDIEFQWVKGHVGTKYNELCDQLAKKRGGNFQIARRGNTRNTSIRKRSGEISLEEGKSHLS